MLVKRSELNQLLSRAVDSIRAMRFHLPPFAYWSPAEWLTRGREYDEIRDNMLGWDITDFGSGDFHRVGLLLFTIRNGNQKKPGYTKPYAEKLLLVEEDQVTPCHFHWNKMEDIINRGGGNLLVQVHNAADDDSLADSPVQVSMDGRTFTVPAGTTLRLTPGESITLPPRLYHKFWGEAGQGPVMLGEVSKVNDDTTDNRFLDNVGRFPEIEEDEPPLHLLCHEYPAAAD
jgi:D-lyxose ketol-isomerase